jgi:hypothetical protein
MTATSGVRLTVDQRQLTLLLRCVREASAAGLLRWDEIADVGDLVELLDARLPSAEERHPAGRLAGHVLLGDEILRVLAAAEDRSRRRLMPDEIDRRLTGKPEGSSIRSTLDRLRRDGLISIGRGTGVCLTSAGRARARRPLASDRGEHAVIDAEQLLDLVARARCGGWTRYVGDEEVEVPAIWHLPTVQGCAGVERDSFDPLVAALEADELIGPAEGSYRTITEAGVRLCAERARAEGAPGGLYGPQLLPPVRRPGEILRRREDTQCPVCGRPASWLRTRSSRRYDELRSSGMTQYACSGCDVSWTVYAEPVDRAGHFDPFGDPARCRARWALRGGYWGPALAPPDHWRAKP